MPWCLLPPGTFKHESTASLGSLRASLISEFWLQAFVFPCCQFMVTVVEQDSSSPAAPTVYFWPVSRLLARRTFRGPWEGRLGWGFLGSCNKMGKGRLNNKDMKIATVYRTPLEGQWNTSSSRTDCHTDKEEVLVFQVQELEMKW